MAKVASKKKKVDQATPEQLLDLEKFADQFKALGELTRLRIVLFLLQSGEIPALPEDREDDQPEGITVGEIACHLTGTDKVSSNISHHLKELRHAGLISMKRQGKNIFCCANKSILSQLSFIFNTQKELTTIFNVEMETRK